MNLVTFLWGSRNRWRPAGVYKPEHVANLQRMWGKPIVCVTDTPAAVEAVGVRAWPLWDWPLPPSGHLAADCLVRFGLLGAPGDELAAALGDDWVVQVDLDTILRKGAEAVLTGTTERWLCSRNLERDPCTRFKSAAWENSEGAYLPLHGALWRVKLGSRPDLWARCHDDEYVREAMKYMIGSDQAVATRYLLEERYPKLEWRYGGPDVAKALREIAPHWDGVAMHGQARRPPVELFTYSINPWLSPSSHIRREYQKAAGLPLEALPAPPRSPAAQRLRRA